MTVVESRATFDIVVIGSGAAGLTAAIVAASGGAKVLIIEKSELIGGTAATSGAGIWIPCSSLGKTAGLEDTPEEAFQYLRALSAPNIPDARIHAFVRNAPAMLDWMTEHSSLRLTSVAYPDYHPEQLGAKLGYRTHFPVDFDGRHLGADVDLIRECSPVANFLGRINLTIEESPALVLKSDGWRRHFARMQLRYWSDIPQRIHSRRDRYLTMGNALIGRLHHTIQQLKISLWRNTSLEDLLCDASRVTGVVVRQGERRFIIQSRCAVIVASGGFERSYELRSKYLGSNVAEPLLSGSQTANTGDSLSPALRIGAAIQNMDSAWWGPVFRVPGEERSRLSAFERALPGGIIVDQRGQRYLNEASSYHIVAQTMLHGSADQSNIPSWFIFDQSFRRRYPVGPLLPIPLWLQRRAVRSMIKCANSPEQLAQQIGVPGSALVATLNRFNNFARQGADADYQRGTSAYDKYCGDSRIGPNPSLAPIEKPPFFAMPLYVGDIGTNGGLATDEFARVLHIDGNPIAGLYAAGNVAASIMGYSYPAAGATLGPALTFAFIAANHALLGLRRQARNT